MLRSMDFSADQLYKPLMITYIQPLDPGRNRSIYIGLSLRQSFVPNCTFWLTTWHSVSGTVAGVTRFSGAAEYDGSNKMAVFGLTTLDELGFGPAASFQAAVAPSCSKAVGRQVI